MTDIAAPLLEVEHLAVDYHVAGRRNHALRGVSFRIDRGERVALVGESGSGKTTTAHAVINLLHEAAEVVGGRIEFDGVDLRTRSKREWRSIRGARIGLVPQDPNVSLNPVRRIGEQIAEGLRIHGPVGRKEAQERAVELLERTGIPDPEQRAGQYPHELSGGQLQRVLIGAALAPGPELLIADEPTSALDVTVQKIILDRLDAEVAQSGASLLLVTHDLSVAAERADRILVFSQGEIVESGTPEQILGHARHPYTQRLVRAAPDFRASLEERPLRELEPANADAEPLLRIDRVSKTYRRGRGRRAREVEALRGVSLDVRPGETVALVGESGSGKSTLSRVVLGIADADEGSVRFAGRELFALSGGEHREVRQSLTLVYQSPFASLSPGLSVSRIVTEPLVNYGLEPRSRLDAIAAELLDRVRLPRTFLDRLPAELSGGQRQRVAIARALSLNPELIVLDEPVSALDVTVQSQILDLLVETQERTGVSYLFITHDLAVVREIAHRVVVLSKGRVQESGPAEQILYSPRAEYTRRLIEAVPGADRHETARGGRS
ncbi:ABC transporter ATP-binding protein [Gulosibacter sp. 10]|uniref:dipeptide ABC transporter ATP-binding protein n=1 Tax=Gulosibacter sp. 10 TaxID=1255570 RepID=UPI00097E9029|nr:ABC transporter ATP-binding protein [Gulosibacter sp. 10]SJM66402.1 Dipeptide transport ATP-binding protein DppD (TC 3.A.1.5.2) [Gulosibacter sp. 10]